MVIADRAGIYVNNVFSGNYGGMTIIVGIILYTLQIYAEFSGCIDIVRGVSTLFGIRLPINFKRPFLSKNVQEFWRRWHISLGVWIKEYVFYPISLSKMNMKVITFCKKKLNDFFYRFVCAAFPLFFVWIVNGIWHGASYKYIAYGMYYYAFMMLELLLGPLFYKFFTKLKFKKFIIDGLNIIRTIIIVMIGMTLFRATSIHNFIDIMKNIFTPGNEIYEYGLVGIDFIILIVSTILLIISGLLEEFKVLDLEKGITKNVILRSVIYSVLILSIIIFGIYGEGFDISNFIYGAF